MGRAPAFLRSGDSSHTAQGKFDSREDDRSGVVGPKGNAKAGIGPGKSVERERDGLPASIDGWFRGKVDAGSLILQPQKKQQRKIQEGTRVEFKERESDLPSALEFSVDLNQPEESRGGTNGVFPERLALRFQSDIFSEESSTHLEGGIANSIQEDNVTQNRSSGEEFGPNGYWYRWTEVSGENESGTVVWTEKWWEVSDWSGMKELGAEKYGMNDRGDAWRETWTEKIVVEEKNKKPMVCRSAHKWARADGGREWEEKWSEMYWSGGKTEKWADKWGKEGRDVWHETWGENYDGQGGCLKWTDRWAESTEDGGSVSKWGDKWREEFKDGKGEKTGETWSESTASDKYQRWWGEAHLGEGRVHKYGNSTTGESWDVTEDMDTYYNPIPHFGYDLALAHSPQLHNVPLLPRDEDLDLDA